MRDEAAGYTAPHLSFEEWEKLLDEVGRDAHGVEKNLVDAEWVVPRKRRHGPSACLPNPRYRAPVSTVAPALRQLALPLMADPAADAEANPRTVRLTAGPPIPMGDPDPYPGALDEFWLDRALSDRGFAADPRNAAMVAGIPGEPRPDPGPVDVAVLARTKSALVVVQDLLTGLGAEHGHPSPGPAACRRWTAGTTPSGSTGRTPRSPTAPGPSRPWNPSTENLPQPPPGPAAPRPGTGVPRPLRCARVGPTGPSRARAEQGSRRSDRRRHRVRLACLREAGGEE